MLPPENSTVYVIRRKAVIEARVVHLIGRKGRQEFMWRGVSRDIRTPLEDSGGGLGRCHLRDEGLTWTRALEGEELDAFRVAVAL